MLEGTSGEMKLPDEREDTIARFIEWAYTGEYPDADPSSNSSSLLNSSGVEQTSSQSDDHDLEKAEDPLLMAHVRLYAFADRFNIKELKQHVFDKLTAQIVTIGVPDTRESTLAMINLISYAFGNLPKCKFQDPLLMYLGMYASWSLESLRKEPEFFELFENDIDFVKELFLHVRKGSKAPWGAMTEDKVVYRCEACPRYGGANYDRPVGQVGCNYCGRLCKTMVSEDQPVV